MRILYYSLFTIHYSLLLSSCNKQPVSSPGNSYQTVKLYDDSLITVPYNIVAGTNVLLMSYQTGQSQSAVMATDNNGNLLWKCPITNSIVTDMLVQNDGSYTLAGLAGANSFSMCNISISGNITDSYFFTFPSNYSTTYQSVASIIRSVKGNNLIFGSIGNSVQDTGEGLIMECDHTGNTLWEKQYYFPQAVSTSSIFDYTYISAGIVTPDGGYIFCGYTQSATFKFFLMKTNSNGDTLWTKFYTTGTWSPLTYLVTPFGASTSSLISLNNGNYLLFLGPYSNSVNKSEWIYTISSSGDSINSAQINLPEDNFPICAVKNTNGSVFALMTQTNSLTAGNGALPQNTALEELNSSLTINSQGYFQTLYNDYFQSLCVTSDGNIACFGMIQSEGKHYYKPEIIITRGP